MNSVTSSFPNFTIIMTLQVKGGNRKLSVRKTGINVFQKHTLRVARLASAVTKTTPES